jgi:pyruvate,water dikinase
MEERFHANLLALIGQRAPRPYHVVVNGWYYYSLNVLSGRAWLRNLPRLVAMGIRYPRRLAGIIPPTVKYSIPITERTWREDVRPRYQSAAAMADQQAASIPLKDLPQLIDDLADLAGEYFTSIATFGGAAYKMEMNLARFYRRHLGPSLGGSHLPLLVGLEAPTGPDSHAVVSLDWWYETAGRSTTVQDSPRDHSRVVATREAAEAAANAALASSPRRLRAFRDLLAEAQRLGPLREAQARELTLPWPAMRHAVVRIGEHLADKGMVRAPDDVFFLRRAEVIDGMAADAPGRIDVASRRALRKAQTSLRPPTHVGHMGPVMRRMIEAFPRFMGAVPSDAALISGTPVSPGRATGLVRVVREPAEFEQLMEGEILVAPLTAPAWTPLFLRAAAVVTDVGSAASHASIVAREYGIPAIVGCEDATSRLRTGMSVVVDGTTGNVERA